MPIFAEQLSETPQQQYVRESLTRALKGVEEAKITGKKLRSVDEFIAELDSEEIEQTVNDMSFFDRFDNDWSDDPRDSHEIADELHNARVNDRPFIEKW